jgi:hypothetical protein
VRVPLQVRYGDLGRCIASVLADSVIEAQVVFREGHGAHLFGSEDTRADESEMKSEYEGEGLFEGELAV